MTDLWTLISWFFYGVIRYIVFWIPYVTPPAVNRSIPWQWWAYNSWFDWLHHDNNHGGPDETWIQAWFKMTFGEALRTATETAKPFARAIRDRLLDLVGTVKGAFSSMSGWVDWLDRLIGGYVPGWAGTLTGGLNWLRVRLPEAIRYGWQSWAGLWESIRESVRSWARDRYDWYRNLANDAWNWVTGTGQAIQAWRDRVAGWIGAVRNDPYGAVTCWLGEAWGWLKNFREHPYSIIRSYLGPDIGKLLTFGRDCVTFYYNLWSRGWRTLGDFVADPLGFLYSRLEQVLTDRW